MCPIIADVLQSRSFLDDGLTRVYSDLTNFLVCWTLKVVSVRLFTVKATTSVYGEIQSRDTREEMSRWTIDKARDWYGTQPWLVGCNFLPGTAINQLEMWQADTYDAKTIDRELGWAEDLGFNTLRVYLNDLVWNHDPEGFARRIDHFLGIADRHGMKVLLVLFDDCHRSDPKIGVQPLPVPGIHNSGWVQSPGQKLVLQFHDGTVPASEKQRLMEYVKSVLTRFKDDERVLMWDIYNEPGASFLGDDSSVLLRLAWEWAREVKVSQPLTACLDGSGSRGNIDINADQSDIITFHSYVGQGLERTIIRLQGTGNGRPIICTEYMAREFGTTFQHSLPIFKKYRVGCYMWGLVAGKSQTHWCSACEHSDWNFTSFYRLRREAIVALISKEVRRQPHVHLETAVSKGLNPKEAFKLYLESCKSPKDRTQVLMQYQEYVNKRLEELRKQGTVLQSGDPIPEPVFWFHDMYRTDGTPFDQREEDFIRDITGLSARQEDSNRTGQIPIKEEANGVDA